MDPLLKVSLDTRLVKTIRKLKFYNMLIDDKKKSKQDGKKVDWLESVC